MPQRKYFSAESKDDALLKAKNYKQKHGDLKGNSFYRLPDGENIRVRTKDGGRLSVEAVATKDKADAKRKSFEQPSTDSAYKKNQADKILRKQINNEASLYRFEGVRNEHIVNQRNSTGFSSGSTGDPNNQLNILKSDSIFKNQLESDAAKLNASVTIDPSSESFRVIPDKFFDPNADPSTLPGVNVPPNSSLDNLADNFKKLVVRSGNGINQLVLDAAPILRNPVVNRATKGVAAVVATSLGVAGDVDASVNGIKNGSSQEKSKQLSGNFDALSGLSGLASLAAPVLGIPSLTFGLASAANNNRIERAQRKERSQDFLANPRSVNPDDNHVLTKSNTSFRSGRY